MNQERITEKLKRNNIPVPTELPEKLYLYFLLLKDWNSRMDLTAVTDDEETLDRHFIDSLNVLKTDLIRENATLIDIGTGAGFPGLPLAIARPDLKVTLMDAQKKRISFLNTVIERLEIGNAITIHSRAEDGARRQELREKFDIAAARALAPLNVLCEYLLPYVQINGHALCWKGPALMTEMETGRKAAHLLGGKLEMPFQCSVEGRDWNHMILPVRKEQKCSGVYPRKAGLPKNKPLGL